MDGRCPLPVEGADGRGGEAESGTQADRATRRTAEVATWRSAGAEHASDPEPDDKRAGRIEHAVISRRAVNGRRCRPAAIEETRSRKTAAARGRQRTCGEFTNDSTRRRTGGHTAGTGSQGRER